MEETDSMMTMMVPIFMAIMMLSVVQGLLPKPPTPPTKDYCCPICGECFYTYDELYTHFTTAHPSEPIDIIWD